MIATSTIRLHQAAASESIIDVLKARASKELVLGVMGAVGCGLPRVVTEFQSQLSQRGYRVVRIKISEFISQQMRLRQLPADAAELDNRYLKLQSAGNALRREHGNDVMAQYVINQITRSRLARHPETVDLASDVPRTAYIVDQLKHPAEVALLRTVYRNNFYLVGVMSLEGNRRSRLKDEGIGQEAIDLIVKRDRKEQSKSGQQLEKAFKLADYFMHHPLGDDVRVEQQVARFLELTHGSNTINPTRHEHGMYLAFATAMKSSCLSRQVGAVITDATGRVIAVGTNDVPRYGGGLYSGEEPKDDRCFNNRKLCENNAEKQRRKNKIRLGLARHLDGLYPDRPELRAQEHVEKMTDLVFEEAGLADLIEFSRAVHAEMDALISLSRGGGGSTVGGTLYATTFPCHNCARHILAAGIEQVYYIEPYEKSLAPTSHDDAIAVLDHDDGRPKSQRDKLLFVHFSGVGPRLYSELFHKESRKSDEGFLLPHADPDGYSLKVVEEFIDSYRSFEAKVADLFENEFSSQISLIDHE